MQSRQALFIDLARRKNLSIRQLYLKIACARGHHIMPPFLLEGLDDFVDAVVPLLQQRGLFRTEYRGTTLREHWGLERPSNRNTR